jgi:hypothetical protein
MLRLLRVIRVLRAFKAVGKWVITLQVLGEAFYSSLGSIMVLILYICLFSMVAGAVLYQQEGSVLEDYSDVPTAMTVVVERFVGKSYSISTTLLSALVLASVGMFKGIIFLLPIDHLKKASKASEKRFHDLHLMRQQVDDEDLRIHCPQETWAMDLRCPAVRVRVFPEGMISTEGAAAGQGLPSTGTLNVPILRSDAVESTICVPLHGGPAQKLLGPRPELEVFVMWRPSGMQNDSLPSGELVIRIRGGRYFSGGRHRHWCVHMEAPEKLYGKLASADWVSPCSNIGSPNPDWGEDAVHTFEIGWEAPGAAKMTVEPPDAKFRNQVLEILEAQTKRIVSLEAEIVAIKNGRTN